MYMHLTKTHICLQESDTTYVLYIHMSRRQWIENEICQILLFWKLTKIIPLESIK